MSPSAQLLARWMQLQAQLAACWDGLARDIAAKYLARAGEGAGNRAPHQARRLLDLWVDCAEEAYAAVVHSDAYCKVQAEAINTAAALLADGLGPEMIPGWPNALRPSTALGPGALWPLPLSYAAGSAVGCSLRDVVWKQDRVTLYRYRPLPFVQLAPVQPVLICFALVNRPHVLDLQPDRSLIRSLLAAGLEVYLIDWGYPDGSDHALSLNDYLERHLAGAVHYVLKSERIRKLNLIGICQGGTLSLCYCALHPGQIANLVLLATPVDFHTSDNLLSKWAQNLDMELLTRSGNLPGALLTGLFMALGPFRLMRHKYVALFEQSADPAALELFGRMEQWVCDSPDLAATAVRQFVQWLYQENRLVRGALRVNSRPVSLQRIRQPVLNIYGTQDHIVPPSATRALGDHLMSRDYTEQALDTGHIGLYVSRHAAQSVPRTICAWLRARS